MLYALICDGMVKEISIKFKLKIKVQEEIKGENVRVDLTRLDPTDEADPLTVS
jgi:hypothetical protein